MGQRIIAVVVVCALVATGAAAQTKEQVSQDEQEQIQGEIKSLQETTDELKGIVDALRKIKITGYLQAQWRWTNVTPEHMQGGSGFNVGQYSGGKFPDGGKNLFDVRRTRLKIKYDDALAQVVLQLDANQTGIKLKDAFVQLTEPWTGSFGLQMGVFDRPFGYEVAFSSGSRETPERARIVQTLFPGERELGAKLFYAPKSGALSFLRADVGVFNGSGPTANEYDSDKDIIARLAAQFPLESSRAEIDLGVSAYFGKVRNSTKYVWTSGTLSNGAQGFLADSIPGNLTNGVTRRYFGADAQVQIDIPKMGGLVVRGEVITGKQPGTGGVNATNTATNSPASSIGPVYQRNLFGYYINLIQNIGKAHQVIAKYDVYDPNTDVAGSDFSSAGTLSPADLRYTTLGVGYIHHWDSHVKFVLYHEWIQNEKVDPAKVSGSAVLAPYAQDVSDNIFTFRVQYKF